MTQLEMLQAWIDNDLPDLARDKIKEWKLNLSIEGKSLIDNSNLTEFWLRKFITVDTSMLILKEHVRKLSLINDEVLIEGETGTGKELIARALHGNREGKYKAVNCAGIPETLMESILFGHTQGAFTGAIRASQGLMREATNGTLFLDEVGELPLELQAKLLRVLQEHIINPVGSVNDIEVNCRFICATNRNLLEMCRAGKFRVDLYARLSTFELKTTPLNCRTHDIKPILSNMEGGLDYWEACHKIATLKDIDISLNVRSLQRAVKRFNVLGIV